jgi:eukaryotic-like serine/threonine-protein kinase
LTAPRDLAALGSPEHGPKRLGGRYELGDLLGIGGMAVVRLATDLRLDRTVAVKMLRGELAENPAFQARFRREARAAASLDHPAVVSVYDAGEETVDGMLTSYIVMEYVQGQDLRALLRSGPVEPRRALEITADILDALTTAHRNGIVHRDIKPANVMLTPTGAIKVMDFGVARAVADMSASLTQTAAVIGTAHYLSPEQARGDTVDARSDVYSTGCLLYELLSGRPPFQGDSAIAVAYQHVREPAQPPSTFAPGLPAEIDAVVLRALAKTTSERHQSADQMRADILAVLAGSAGALPTGAEVGTLVPPQSAESAASTTQQTPAVGTHIARTGGGRRRRLVLLAAAAAVVALAGVAGYSLSGLDDDTPVGQRVGPPSAHRDASRPSAQTTQAPAEETDTASVDEPASPLERPQRQPAATRTPKTRQERPAEARSAPPSETVSSSAPEPSPEQSTPQDTASQTPPSESPTPEPTPSQEPPPATGSPAAAPPA